jgi:hypothetical protein
VAEDTAPAFEIDPGRWRVDALVTLPREAALGVNTLEVHFESREHRVRFEDRVPFGVVAPPPVAQAPSPARAARTRSTGALATSR